jgi:hypothetical protein
MKSLIPKIHLPAKRLLLVMAYGVGGAGCGQDPSFVEQQELKPTQGSADANASGWTDPTGQRSGRDWNADDYMDERRRADMADSTDDSITDGSGLDGMDDPPPLLQLFDVEQSFSAGSLENTRITVDLPAARSSTDVVMTRVRTPKVFNFVEPMRNPIRDQFRQGTAGRSREDVTTQVANKALDVLVVVDNSGSMVEEQKNLSTKLAPLIEKVADADWQIGIVTTDPRDGCLQELVKKSDPNAASKFEKAIVNAGINGSGNEQGIYQAVRALNDGCTRTRWLREQSTVAVLIVADEDNCSDGNDCRGQAHASADYLLDHLRSIRQVGVTARVYGIFWHPNDVCSTGYNRANIYNRAVEQASGTYGSICSSDYTPTLQKISADMAVILGQQMLLSETPDPGSLRVSLNGVETSQYRLSGNVVAFDLPPAEGTEMRASYIVGSRPMLSRFTLSKRPYQGIVDVRANGMVVPSDQYQFDGATNELVFTQIPVDSAQVQASYLEDVILVSDFSLSGEVDPSTLSVSIDNVQINDYDFDSANSRLSLHQVPNPGSRVGIRYTQLGAMKTRFDFAVEGKQPEALQVSDADSGVEIAHAYLNGAVQISTSEFVEGRNVRFSYRNPSRGRASAALPGTPMDSSVRAVWPGGECGPAQLEVKGGSVGLAPCAVPADVTQLEIIYDNWMGKTSEFIFDNLDLTKVRPVKWTVTVNGQATKNFSRKESGRFEIKDSLQPGDVVTIIGTMENLLPQVAAAQ